MAQSNYKYYSDYFVFVSSDDLPPLVIPMDINWSPDKTGYSSEFKGWYGTKNKWPIAYFQKHIKSNRESIPQETWEHKNGPYFQFNDEGKILTAKIDGAPKLDIIIPEKSNWVQMPSSEDKEIFVFQANANVGKKSRSGWVIYERIRWTEETAVDFGDFQAFYWLPLIIDNVFYHFEQHKGEQTATRWFEKDGQVMVESLPNYELTIKQTTRDKQSGRDNIPQVLKVIAPKWNLNLLLESKGSQVGYGPKFPKGLGYYRQSLLTSSEGSSHSAYGMLELILERD